MGEIMNIDRIINKTYDDIKNIPQENFTTSINDEYLEELISNNLIETFGKDIKEAVIKLYNDNLQEYQKFQITIQTLEQIIKITNDFHNKLDESDWEDEEIYEEFSIFEDATSVIREDCEETYRARDGDYTIW